MTTTPSRRPQGKRRWLLVSFVVFFPVILGAVLIGGRTRIGDFALRIQLQKALDAGEGLPIDMDRMAAFSWDRMTVLGPYASRADQKEAGLPLTARYVANLSNRDDISILVFTINGNYRAHAVLERAAMDFSAAAGREFSRENAVFTVKPTATGVELHPEQ